MTLKTVSFLAMIGTFLATILVAVNFLRTITGISSGIVPAMELVPCSVYLFAGITVTAFFWIFNKSQG